MNYKIIKVGLIESTVRSKISNIGRATYETAKYLNNFLLALGKSQHALLKSKEFVEKINAEKNTYWQQNNFFQC